MTPEGFRLPDDSQRHAIVGRTGSGKTQAAVWHLSQRSFDVMPWIIYDFKGDKLIGALPTKEIELGVVPDEPGLYIVRPYPDQGTEINDHFFRMWEHENIGLYIDEAYMIGQHNPGYRTLLTQGRSLTIPIISLSQRPVKVDTFSLSEADFIQSFALNNHRDKKTIEEYMPVDMSEKLEKHTSWYYDVGEDRVYKFNPVPDAQTILGIFRKRFEVAEKAGEPIPTAPPAALRRI